MPSPFSTVGKLFRRFRRNRGGSAAVDFALVAPIFFALLFAIIESAMVFFASQLLETVTADSARLVMTGQAQAASMTAVAVQDQSVRSRRHIVRLRQRHLYRRAELPVVLLSQPCRSDRRRKKFVPPNNFSPGGPGDIVVVRVFYKWPLFVTSMGYDISNLTGGKRLLTATAAFQNEPYLEPMRAKP